MTRVARCSLIDMLRYYLYVHILTHSHTYKHMHACTYALYSSGYSHAWTCHSVKQFSSLKCHCEKSFKIVKNYPYLCISPAMFWVNVRRTRTRSRQPTTQQPWAVAGKGLQREVEWQKGFCKNGSHVSFLQSAVNMFVQTHEMADCCSSKNV